MSQEQLHAFLESVRSDPALQQRLRDATDAEMVVRIARDAGFSISPDELKPLAPEELSDADLEGFAGGVGFNLDTFFCGNFP